MVFLAQSVALRRPVRSLDLAIAVTLSVTLLTAFRLWSFSYFWTDDFNNLFLVRSETFLQMVGYIVDPQASYFRPVGMFVYWALYQLFGLHPLPYHLTAWALHALNTFLLFLLLRRWLHSPFAAAAGAIPFALRVNFADVYWSFGSIFELLACGLMLTGLYVWTTSRKTPTTVLLLTLIAFVAVRSKEMAVTLPALWLWYECCVTPEFWKYPRRLLSWLALPFAVMAWLTLVKVQSMQGAKPSDPYYLKFGMDVMVSGFGQYLDWLSGIHLPTLVWILGAAVTVAIFIYRRERFAVFFVGYVLLTFMPVIFLANHRWPFFWYIPFPGVAGLIALAAARIEVRVQNRELLAGLLVVLALANGGVEFYRSRATRTREAELAREFESFVTGLKAMDPPSASAVLYFDGVPSNFTPQVLSSAVRLVLERDDIRADLVEEFPAGATQRYRFAGGKLRRLPAQ